MTKSEDKTNYIYVFYDKDNPTFLKVGESDNVSKRFHGETRTASAEAGKYKLIGMWEAVKNDTKEIFHDHDVHKVLKKSGYLTTKTKKNSHKEDSNILKKLLAGEFSLDENCLTSKAGSEWFIIETDDNDIESAVAVVGKAVEAVKEGRSTIFKEKETFSMREEQRVCCEKTANYMKAHEADVAPTRFLWNCKMRFGKTFTAYQLVLAMGWKRILVLTFKPVVLDSWRTDLLNHKDFEDWQFVDKETNFEVGPDNEYDPTKKTVAFYSFQYLMTGHDNNKTMKNKDIEKGAKIRNKIVEAIGGEWDCVILDEYHFGAWRHIQKLLASDYITDDEKKELKAIQAEESLFDEENNNMSSKFSIEGLQEAGFESHHFLYLSGTPFRALKTGEFGADQVYSWTYLDEQKKKAELAESHSELYKQYEWLPKVEFYTYEMPQAIRDKIVNDKTKEFDLNAFFDPSYRSASDDEYNYTARISGWLESLYKHGLSMTNEQNKCYPLSYMKKKHLVWFLPSVASCKAMVPLLEEHIGDSYEIICCAGNEAGIGFAALIDVKRRIGLAKHNGKGSITLTCGKLLTGVTIPQWEGIFMLSNCKEAGQYLQAAFRVQSAWPKGHKKTCCVFDFSPVRTIEMCYKMSILSGQKLGDSRGYIRDILNFCPIIAFNANNGMKAIDVDDIMNTIANITTPKDVKDKWSIKELFNNSDFIVDKILNNKSLIEKFNTLGFPAEYHGKGKQATFSDVEINGQNGVIDKVKRSRNGGNLNPNKSNNKTSKEEQQRMALQAKLKFIAERLRIYMYLTDLPEMEYSDIFMPREIYKKDCDEMFKMSMGYLSDSGIQFTLNDLQELFGLGIISEEDFNLAVYSFYDIEEKQFRNMGIDRSGYNPEKK